MSGVAVPDLSAVRVVVPARRVWCFCYLHDWSSVPLDPRQCVHADAPRERGVDASCFARNNV